MLQRKERTPIVVTAISTVSLTLSFCFWLLLGPLSVSESAEVRFAPTPVSEHPEAAACEIGPDGNLYVVSMQRRGKSARSMLTRYFLSDSGEPTGKRELIYRWEVADQMAMGLAFSPTSTPSDLTAYVSINRKYKSDNDDGPTNPWGGSIVRVAISGKNVAVRDVVKNLPIGFHAINDLTFGPGGKLYVCAGSTTTSGGAGIHSAEHPEKVLSAAILELELRQLKGVLDAKTSDGGRYDPYRGNAPLKIFASAIRQPWDCAWHPNGRLYMCSNQNDVNGETGTGPGVPNLKNIKPREYLAIARRGATYGFPNASRGEYVLMGGNPTAGNDGLWEIPDYPVGVKPPVSFDPSLLYRIDDIGGGSADGMIAYHAPGSLQGRLMVCFFGRHGKGRIWAFQPGSDGKIVGREPLHDDRGREISIPDCLDLCQHPRRGHLYVTRYGSQNGKGKDGQIWFLRRTDEVDSVSRVPQHVARTDDRTPAAAKNRPPIVDAGQALTVAPSKLPVVLDLQGIVRDDGEMDSLSSEWTVVDNPTGGRIRLESSRLPTTRIAIYQAGRYTLRLTADDGEFQAKSQVVVSVDSPGNRAPDVTIGSFQKEITIEQPLQLSGSATDDGLPRQPGKVQFTWARIGTGVGVVQFADAHDPATSATFSDPGPYRLRLTVDDGVRTAFKQVEISVLPGQQRSALLVVGNSRLSPGDKAIAQAMRSAGLDVEVMNDRQSPSTLPKECDLAFISATVTSARIGKSFRDVAFPVIVCESWLFDDMGITGPDQDVDFGKTSDRGTGLFVKSRFQATGKELEGVTQVSKPTLFYWGRPAKNAKTIATLTADPESPAAIFSFEKGDKMHSGKAPARRVGFFLDDDTAARLTPDGQLLLDAAIRWCITDLRTLGASTSKQ